MDPQFFLPKRHEKLQLQQVRLHFNTASRDLQKIQKNSGDLRLVSYEALLARYDADMNNSTKNNSKRKAKIVTQTIASEMKKAMYSKLRQIVKPSEYHTLSKLEIPRAINSKELTSPGHVQSVLENEETDNLIWYTIITKEDIEDHLVTFNRIAFRAAEESPCGNGIIHDALTFTSLSKEAEEMLYGEVPPEWYGDDTLLKEFLASFQIPDSVLSKESISTDISAADIAKGFRSWKESTTTSPSGRHLGHCKALIQDTLLLKCLQQFLQIVISRGISIPRWSNAVNAMIEKDPGRPKVNRLRIIHLFEADYNLLLKIMWGSRLVRRAVSLDLLNSG